MSDELTRRIERLRRKLANEADPIERSDLEAAIAALEAHRDSPPAGQTITGSAQVGVAVAGDALGNVTGITGSVTGPVLSGTFQGSVYLIGQRTRTAEELLGSYLQQLMRRCGSVPLEGLRQQTTLEDGDTVNLPQIYTQLTIAGDVARETFSGAALRTLDLAAFVNAHRGATLPPWQRRVALVRPRIKKEDARERLVADEPGTDPRTIREPLDGLDLDQLQQLLPQIDTLTFLGPALVTDALAANQRLVLLGEPGSGKSTVLRYLALMLADAGLNHERDPAASLAGWEQLGIHGRLLPIFVPLLPFARQLATDATLTGAAHELWRFLADQLAPNGIPSGLAEAVHEEIVAGRALIMLDGLDEVAGEDSRRKVVRAVRDFAHVYPTCRIVVSCRVRAYEGEANRAWQLPSWPTVTLQEWDTAQQQHFVAAWFATAVARGSLLDAQRAGRTADLQRAIVASPDLQRLAGRPLLLTIMALVHLNDGRLPEDRVTLYRRCIDILLAQWELRRASEYGSLMSYIGLPDRDIQRLSPLLTKAAYTAHQAGTADSPGSLGKETLRLMVVDHLAGLGHPEPRTGAERFLAYTDHRAGLIHASSASDAYVFPHLTFQEYLAGLELTGGSGVVARIMAHRDDDRWRVPILLGVGDYVSGNHLEMPFQLLHRLLTMRQRTATQRERDLIFAAEIIIDVGRDRLEQGGDEFVELRRDLAVALAAVVEGAVLPAAERVRASVLLGALDDPRPGVCDLPPRMISITGGGFVIGDNPNQRPNHVDPFELARYPITNAQYQHFMNADGYRLAAPWWEHAGRAWLKQEAVTEPRFWQHDHNGIALPNHPVVGISWYEATAFCRWLIEYLNDGFVYRLPSELEWEYAARGPKRRTYAWGDQEPDQERANFNNLFKGTSAVGCFSQGETPEGLMDMAGNVWEWTRSVYRRYPYDPEDGREDPSDPVNKRFTLRGGGWYDHPISLRASSRDFNAPDLRNFNVGFRLARHAPL